MPGITQSSHSEAITPIKVSCYSGTEYPERPLLLEWGDEYYIVSEVVRSWRTPGCKWFQVKTADERVWTIFYDEHQDIWMTENT